MTAPPSMDIPYTVERRADTGTNNVTLGMWLFLASEAMLFGGLFSAYVLLRSGPVDWPSGVSNVLLGAANTAVLLISSMTIALARRTATNGLEARTRMLMGVTAALGAAFLGIKVLEYSAKISAGLLPAVSTYLALYFLLTAVHGVHVFGGVLANAHLAMSGTCATDGSMPRYAGRVSVAALYWHFVDLVWLCLFVMLYVV